MGPQEGLEIRMFLILSKETERTLPSLPWGSATLPFPKESNQGGYQGLLS